MHCLRALAISLVWVATANAQSLYFPDGISVSQIAGTGQLVPIGDANGDGFDDLGKVNPRASPVTGTCLLVVPGGPTPPATQTPPASGGQWCTPGDTQYELSTLLFRSTFCGPNTVIFGPHQSPGGGYYSGGRAARMPIFGTAVGAIRMDCAPGTISNVGDVSGDSSDDFVMSNGGGAFMMSPTACSGTSIICNGPIVRGTRSAVRVGDVGGSSAADIAYIYNSTVYIPFELGFDNFNLPGNDQAIRIFSTLEGEPSTIARDIDLDGDGRSDVVVAFDYSDAGEVNAGRIFVIFGQQGGLQLEIDLDQTHANVVSIGGELPGQRLGEALDTADFDGDGITDLIASSRIGDTYVIFGSDHRPSSGSIGSLSARSTTIRSGGGFLSVDTGLDYNADGIHDLGAWLEGSPNYYVLYGRSAELLIDSFE